MSMDLSRHGKWIALGVVAAAVAAWWFTSRSTAGAVPASLAAASAASGKQAAASSAVRPALSVRVVSPQWAEWPTTVQAHGALAPWQETVIGAELAGLRMTEVLSNVGDSVRRGQTLAVLSRSTVQADLASAKANWLEAMALLSEARGNAERTRKLLQGDAVSAQEAQRFFTAEQTALARVESLKARVAAEELRFAQTVVVAPDDGVISARIATVGAVVQPGQELFRLIRQHRLEWRAEVPADQLARLRPGMVARLTPAGGTEMPGRVRMVAPTVDAATRNGLVYVDVPTAMANGARAGMFASGRLEVGRSRGLTLPQTAVLIRDGFSQVFVVGSGGKVVEKKVKVGRRSGDRVEITDGLDPSAVLVASGGGFLADGDTVRVVNGAARGKP